MTKANTQEKTAAAKKTGAQQYKIAILIPGQSPGIVHYTERFSAFFHVVLPNILHIDTIDFLPYLENKDDFVALAKNKKYDFYLTFTFFVGKALSDLVEEYDLDIRGLSLFEQGIEHQPLCSRLGTYYAHNNGQRYAELFRQLLPDITTAVVCASDNQLSQDNSEVNVFAAFLEKEGLSVVRSNISHEDEWRKKLVGLPPEKTGVFISFEGETQPLVAEIVSTARENKYFTMSANVYAIHQGVDFAFGYAEQAAIGEVAEKVVEYLEGAPLRNDPVSLPLSLHANVTRLQQHLSVIKKIEELVVLEEENNLKVHLHNDEKAAR